MVQHCYNLCLLFWSGHAMTWQSSSGHTPSRDTNSQVRIDQTWTLERFWSPAFAFVWMELGGNFARWRSSVTAPLSSSVITERIKLWVRAECPLQDLCYRVRSTIIQESLRIDPLLLPIERRQVMWFDASSDGRLPLELDQSLVLNLGPVGEIISHSRLCEGLGIFQKEVESVKESGLNFPTWLPPGKNELIKFPLI